MSNTPKTRWMGRVAFAALVTGVCLPYADAQCSGRPVAQLVEVLGQVSVLRDGHADIPLDLAKHNQVCAQQEVVTGPQSFARFHLEDNSTFEVYANSHVIFKSDWPSWTYLLNVFMGRVKVFIDHSKGPNNNSVMTPTAVISVRGTVFDVDVEDSDGTTLVSCDEGLVQVRNLTAPGAEPLLHPGESYRVIRGQGIMGKQISHSPIVGQVLRAAREAVQLALQRKIGLGAPGGPVGSTTGPGAQGDKGKGGATPPPVPTTGSGH